MRIPSRSYLGNILLLQNKHNAKPLDLTWSCHHKPMVQNILDISWTQRYGSKVRCYIPYYDLSQVLWALLSKAYPNMITHLIKNGPFCLSDPNRKPLSRTANFALTTLGSFFPYLLMWSVTTSKKDYENTQKYAWSYHGLTMKLQYPICVVFPYQKCRQVSANQLPCLKLFGTKEYRLFLQMDIT